MKFRIIFLIAFLCLTSDVFAYTYPISPRPLRQLVIESQFIIVGYVVKTYDNKDSEDDWDSKVAKIAVLQNLQGKPNKDTIEIEFNSNMYCPEPDKYFDGTFVISFIDKNKKGKFCTHALSYGAKTLNKDEIEIYKQRILEIQQILEIPDKEKQFAETVEWLVKCAEIETTRWEGTFELSSESNFMPYYSGDEKEDFSSAINTEQKERLKKVLLSTNGMVDFGIVDLVYSGNETLVDEYLLSNLKTLDENDYWIAGKFMNRLKHKNNSREMEKILEDYDRFRFEYKKKDKLKNAIEKFIGLIEQ